MGVSPATWIKAKAIALGINAMIGEEPTIQAVGNYLEIDFTEPQRQKLMAYLDSQVMKLFRTEEAPAPELQVRFGKVLIPWGLKYFAPVLLSAAAGGFMANSIIFPKRRR